MTAKKIFSVLITSFACFLLAACQSISADAQVSSDDTGATVTPVGQTIQTGAPTFTATPYQPVTITPSPTVSPTPTLTPTPVCQEQHGKVERFQEQFNTPQAGYYSFTFRVYTPPCMDASQGKRYPVLYMIHGQTFADDQWDTIGADEAADALITSKQVPPFLIVMPREDDTYEDIYKATFTTDITQSLIAWIDSHYPTCTDRACRAIGGLSRGGAWSLRLGFQHWELFSAIGLHSTPPFIGDPNQFVYWERDIPAGQMPAIYMDIGQNDPWLSASSSFEKLLTSLNISHEWFLNDGNHNMDYWSAHITEYLLWYGGNWKNLPESTQMGQ